MATKTKSNCHHTPLSSSVVAAIDDPIISNTSMYKNDPSAGITGTAVAAVHGHKSIKIPNERLPDNTKATAAVTASREARPIRMISIKWQIELLPGRLNTEE